jgi:hypothetical protein
MLENVGEPPGLPEMFTVSGGPEDGRRYRRKRRRWPFAVGGPLLLAILAYGFATVFIFGGSLGQRSIFVAVLTVFLVVKAGVLSYMLGSGYERVKDDSWEAFRKNHGD